MQKKTALIKELSPSVRYLTSVLTERIRSGIYEHGRWLPSERALASEFAVCRPTIRQAIAELEQEQLIRRSAGFRPIVWNGHRDDGADRDSASASAPFISEAAVPTASVRERAAQSLALWVSGTLQDMGPIALTNGVHQGLATEESTFRLVTAYPQVGGIQAAIRSEAETLARWSEDPDIAGVILWYLGGQENRAALERLRRSGKVIVFVDREPPVGFEADFVGIHNAMASSTAVRYLIKLGHRRIAHITNADRASTVLERKAGYIQALGEAHLPVDPALVVAGPFKSDQEEEGEWRGLLERLLGMPDPPTAFFTVNDYTAYRLIRTLRTLGRRIPEELAVVGFDNSERWSALDPFMTSVSQPFEQIGAEAARLLLTRLATAPTHSFRHVLLPTELVIRASTETVAR